MEVNDTRLQTAYLQQISARYPNLEIKSVHLVDKGEFNDILIVNEELIFRFPRSVDGIERLKVEIAILNAIQERIPLAVPNPSFVSEDMQTVGAVFMGYPLIPGEPLKDHLETLKRSGGCEEMAMQLSLFLKELHNFPVEIIGADLPICDRGRRAYLPKMYEDVRQHLYSYIRSDARDLITDQFDSFLGDSNNFNYTRAIKHGDIGPGNILFNSEVQAISGVIDFGSAGLDDPAIDLGLVALWGEDELGESFVEQFNEGYNITESLLRRVQFFKMMIALWVALGGVQSDNHEMVRMGLKSYM